MEKYGDSLEYDLFCRTGHSTKELGSTLDWATMYNFVTHLDEHSAFAKQVSPDAVEWGSITKTNFILADIFDMLSAINYNVRQLGGGKTLQKPKPYPRPGKNSNKQRFGKGAIPVTDIRDWVKSYRKK